MFLTNLTKSRLGISGTVVLAPGEVNRYVSEKDATTLVRAYKLQQVGLVSIIKAPGLTKTVTSKKVKEVKATEAAPVVKEPELKEVSVIKLNGVDEAGVTKAPRTPRRRKKAAKTEESMEAAEKAE